MVINPLNLRNMKLDNSFIIVPESPLNPAHHLPGGSGELAFACRRLVSDADMFPASSVSGDATQSMVAMMFIGKRYQERTVNLVHGSLSFDEALTKSFQFIGITSQGLRAGLIFAVGVCCPLFKWTGAESDPSTR